MRALAANIEEVFREAAARWTLLAYFFLSTIFIAIFATAVNLDVVDGALAGLKLFGNEVQLGGEQPDIQELVLGFESVFSGVLFVVSLFLAVFATAHLVPRLQDKGTIDLYLSRPVGRVSLLLSRYVAGLLLAAANIAYLILSIWLIVTWKTHVVHPRFLLGGAVILFAIAALLAFAFLIGVLTSSTAVSIMVSYGLFFISLVLAAHDRIEAAVESQWSAWLVHGLYVAMPKMVDLLKAVVAFVSDGTGPGESIVVTPWPFVTTAIFGLVSLSLACWLFRRKEF
ncbi:MAG: ABC transporter permease subunit [Thermoanaerobaculia bacterium]